MVKLITELDVWKKNTCVFDEWLNDEGSERCKVILKEFKYAQCYIIYEKNNIRHFYTSKFTGYEGVTFEECKKSALQNGQKHFGTRYLEFEHEGEIKFTSGIITRYEMEKMTKESFVENNNLEIELKEYLANFGETPNKRAKKFIELK